MFLRYKIKPISPMMTPLMSDTLFGHFCWAVRYKKGEDYLENFLSFYKKGNPPPVLFSSAVASGYLPRPVLPSLKRKQTYEFVEKFFIRDPDNLFSDKTIQQKRFEGMLKIKEWNKRQLISKEDWQALKENYSEYGLLERFYQQFKENSDKDTTLSVSEITASNTINRITGSVQEDGGGLFSREKTWFSASIELDLYVETITDEFTAIAKWFLENYLPENGFGKDKSTGMGSLDISEDRTFNPDIFKIDSANAVMVMSLCSFEGMENHSSFYRLKTKFGRLGGDFAFSSPTGGEPKPFKKPILMMEPGSILFTTEPISANCLISGVHSDERIRHCGLPVTLPLKIMEEK